MTVVHAIPSAWLTTGGTGAQNYDEFADDAEITEIISANPRSALAIEMPHKAPDSLGKTFEQSLQDAVNRLAQAKADGAYAPFQDVVVLYRISDRDQTSYGLWAMVDTDQISASADEPGLIIRNEDVFPEKVRERVALAEALGHLLSPVLLLQTGRGDELHAALAQACQEAGEPQAADVDPAGRTHEIWPVPPGELADRLAGLAGGGDLVVADGNHRSLAAQTGGLQRFLAVITTPASVRIDPYNRLVREVLLPDIAPGDRLRVYSRAGMRAVALPDDPALGFVDNMDHALVERALLGGMLGLEPGDKRITYVGGDYPESWLMAEVDEGRADLAILIDPVTVPDFIQVNLDRQKMPRKSTWFTPKARAGLVLAQLA
ncbi:hypothetical protein Rhe02_73410 [Rhizocola hellebori]|uniref:DUF1015 domain-containing protein n=1 Tax=Rhizocola hellebori TaxID=1392758 RepID=A0A8J3QGK8_9ACTN|nr:DUF1015 family protein [Rhizocola hellebori]GIH09274.1 hypothetical protein Rhe02_73410 [Rhizocola hellebori]